MKQLTTEQKAAAFDALAANKFTAVFIKDFIEVYDYWGNYVCGQQPYSPHGLAYDLHAAIMRADGMGEESDKDPGYCRACNGSGEGMYDGSRCGTCRGKGEV